MRPSEEWTTRNSRATRRQATTAAATRLRAFFETFALRELLGHPRGAGPCRRCGGPRPDGPLSLFLDVQRGPAVCPGCQSPVDPDGRAVGRLLPTGEVVLQELVLIERR